MLDSNRHIVALQQAYEVLFESILKPESVAAAVIGLYGLRVLSASSAHYSQPSAAEEFVQRWNSLKRETEAVAVALNRALNSSGQILGIEALSYHPDYRSFQEDGLTRAILVLDKLDATISQSEDAHIISRAVNLFLTQRIRGQADITPQLTTPGFLNELGAELLTVDLENRFYSVYDPTCGVGGSLRAVHKRLTARGITESNATFFGQDVNEGAVFIAAWNLFLSGVRHFKLEVGDTLREPRFLRENELQRFSLVIAQPPAYYVSDDDFGPGDPFSRFRYGTVQSSRADYAFVQHAIASLQTGGRAVITMPLTTLSRSGFEEEIRANLVHSGILSACTSFRGSLALSKNTPAAMLSFDLGKPSSETQGIFFIDAPVESPDALGRSTAPSVSPTRAIVDMYRLRRTKRGLSKAASLEEVRAHYYSLAPQAYIPREGSASLDTQSLDQEIEAAGQEVREAQFAFRHALGALRNMRSPRRTAKRAVKPE